MDVALVRGANRVRASYQLTAGERGETGVVAMVNLLLESQLQPAALGSKGQKNDPTDEDALSLS